MPGPFVGHVFLTCSATGWTETWYPLGADITEAGAFLDKIATASLGLKDSGVKCKLLKVSDMTVKGDVQWVFPTTLAGTYVPTVPPSKGAVDCNTALKYTLLGTDPKHRSNHFMRGLPLDVCDLLQPATINVDANFATNQGLLLTELKRSAQLVFPDKANPGKFLTTSIVSAIYPAQSSSYNLSIRRSGRPFDLRRGRARV